MCTVQCGCLLLPCSDRKSRPQLLLVNFLSGMESWGVQLKLQRRDLSLHLMLLFGSASRYHGSLGGGNDVDSRLRRGGETELPGQVSCLAGQCARQHRRYPSLSLLLVMLSCCHAFSSFLGCFFVKLHVSRGSFCQTPYF